MTIPPASSRVADVPDRSSAFRVVRDQGLRLTASRRLVLEALFAAGVPVGAEQIAAGLGGELPQSDVTSVYRNLERLESIGIVRHTHLGHGPALYMIADASREFVLVKHALEQFGRQQPVSWIQVDTDKALGRMTQRPTRDAIPIAAQEQLIVELYSK